MNKKIESDVISKEKLDWMNEVELMEFEHPMKYYSYKGMIYSEHYIKNTPLEELQAAYKKFHNNNLRNKWIVTKEKEEI